MSDINETRPLLGVRVNSQASSSSRRISNGINGSPLRRNLSQDVPARDYVAPSNSWHVHWALFTILMSVVLEKISFYGLTGNLVLFLNMAPFQWESYHAMNALLVFYGITYIVSLIGGWVADSCLGRYKAMLFAFLIYMSGHILLPFVAETDDIIFYNLTNTTDGDSAALPKVCINRIPRTGDIGNPFQENCSWLIYVTLIIIGIGAGSMKSSICPFGSEQLSRANQQTQLSFFNWFYWCVNIGSFIGLGAVAYIQQQHSFQIGYIIGTVTLGCSFLVFIMGRCCYVIRPPDGSVLTNIFRILKEAWKRKRQRKQLLLLNKKSILEGSHGAVEAITGTEEKISFLDHAKLRHGGIFHNSLVDDVKKLGMILAVFAVLIPYWLVYFQMQTTFLFQGLHMNLGFSKNSTSDSPVIVAAWFSLFDAIFVIILLPLFDRVIYPRMAKAGYPFSFTKRIVIGMLFAMAAMIVAGVVEHFRLQSFWSGGDGPCGNSSIRQVIGNTTYFAAEMSVFWQIPQYALIGISEVFASVACLQFTVTLAPKSMKAIITGLYYFFSGIGSLMGTAILTTLASSKTWFYKYNFGNINCRYSCPVDPTNLSKLKVVSTGDCHLDYYFYMLAGVDLVAIFLFLIVAWVFQLSADQLALTVKTKDGPGEKGGQHIQRQSLGANIS
ncbi:solute carrier family 15 member 4-like isoform X2 [Physella acuta]|uniref:solute carrier family 15 member 4-like isoform X2 n=1 Tax=Physella acuta TaxID=109671 RepID=UPI0027DAF7B1|nr:solute carrier family 15 member 4-like isoform X2 [Physella acuta]